MTRGVSIADVAADARVSTTTVSHALSGNRLVSEPTRRRIQESVDRLGYRPNLVARGLRTQRTHTVALLVADISNPYYPALARAVTDVLSPSGYIAFIGNTDGDPATERKFLEEAVARNVDGIIIQPMSLEYPEVRDIAEATALVLIGDLDGTSIADVVSTDTRGITEAVQHLVSRGRIDIGFLGGPIDRAPGPARLRAFESATVAAGLTVPERHIAHAAFTRDGGYLAASEMFSRAGSSPAAVICANDLIAIGVMDAAREFQLHIPDDIAVVGFDNIDTASLLSTQLTTVDNAVASVGYISAKTLLNRIEDPHSRPFRSIALPTRLVVRQST